VSVQAAGTSGKLRRRWSTSARLLLAVALIVTVPLGAVWIVVWNEVDRPLQQIERALSAKQTPQALELVGQYLREHPDDARAQALRARILVESGQLADALRIFHRIGAANVADLHAWSKAHLLRQEWSEAVPVLERLLELEPNDPDALHEVTAARAFLGKYRQAFESAERLAAQPGHEARAWLQIGTLHENMGNTHSAAEAWKRVLDYDPRAEGLQVSAADFLAEYGKILLIDGQPERARAILDRSVEVRETPEALTRLGRACQQLGDEPQAIVHWKRAVELAPTLREPREFLAQDAFRNGQFAESRTWLEPVISQASLPSSSTYLMQRICLALNQPDLARVWQKRTEQIRQSEKLQAAINQVIKEAPESFWARVIRAYHFAESGNWHQADVLTRGLLNEAGREPFVRELSKCVRNHGPLPSLELLPIHQF
jgi:tetratricopeptide (TPR) repeat protein